MDLNEAVERIFKYHWVLIVLVTLLGVAAPIGLSKLQDDAYVASARFTIGQADNTKNSQASNSMADTALGVATSPGVLRKAIATAGVQRNQALLASEVTVQPVGTSSVLQLSVTDADPKAAASIANALTKEVVAERTQTVLGDTEKLLADTDAQIQTLTQTVANIGAEADAAAKAEAAARLRGEVPGNTVQAVALRYQQAVGQLNDAQSHRQDLAATIAAAVRPAIVDDSATRGVLVASSLLPRVAVGALLGLILGIALAATLEAWRPTLSPAALARHLGVPLLGRLRRLPKSAGALPDPWLASYVTLAADGAGVRSFELVPVGPDVNLTGLARSLAAESEGGHEIVPVALDGPHNSRLPAAMANPGTGLVVVAPTRVKSTWLANLERHVRLTRQPVIGVIAYGGKGHGPVAQESTRTTPVRPGRQSDAASAAAATS